METQAEAAFGVILKKGDGATPVEAFSDWGLEITDVTPPGWTREAIDATHHQSPNGWGEIIMSGIKRQKPFTIEFNWVPSDTHLVKTAIEAGLGNWQFLFPDATTLTVAAAITDFSPGAMPVDGKMTGSAEFAPSGEPVWDPDS